MVTTLDFKTCPVCGALYAGAPALSRDGKKSICPDCGIREALASLDICLDEQEKILAIIHRHSRKPGQSTVIDFPGRSRAV